MPISPRPPSGTKTRSAFLRRHATPPAVVCRGPSETSPASTTRSPSRVANTSRPVASMVSKRPRQFRAAAPRECGAETRSIREPSARMRSKPAPPGQRSSVSTRRPRDAKERRAYGAFGPISASAALRRADRAGAAAQFTPTPMIATEARRARRLRHAAFSSRIPPSLAPSSRMIIRPFHREAVGAARRGAQRRDGRDARDEAELRRDGGGAEDRREEGSHEDCQAARSRRGRDGHGPCVCARRRSIAGRARPPRSVGLRHWSK